MHPDSRHRGFSLVEVLVAFSIAAVALGMVVQIYGKGLVATDLTDEYADAVAIAESRLAEHRVDPAPGHVGASGVTADGYRWESRFAPYEAGTVVDGAPPRVALETVEVEVSWENRQRERSVTLTSLRLVARP
jgi:general secretion pathway protein I